MTTTPETQALQEAKTQYAYFEALLNASSQFLEATPSSAHGEALGLHFSLKERVSQLANQIHVLNAVPQVEQDAKETATGSV